MNYVKACQMEVMRINPVTLGSSRILDKDIEVGGYMVGKYAKNVPVL